MTLRFQPHQTVRFATPALGSGFPIGGPRTDAALAHAAAIWQRGHTELEESTFDWLRTVREFLRCARDIDAATARRFQCL